LDDSKGTYYAIIIKAENIPNFDFLLPTNRAEEVRRDIKYEQIALILKLDRKGTPVK
jgi:hypothetical protein